MGIKLPHKGEAIKELSDYERYSKSGYKGEMLHRYPDDDILEDEAFDHLEKMLAHRQMKLVNL